MYLLAHRNLNFHTQGLPGGLVFCQAGTVTKVPDDVADKDQNPWFQDLINTGYVTQIGTPSPTQGPVEIGGAPGPTGQPLHDPDDEDKNVKRPAPDEDDLGPAVSQQEFELRQPLKPVAPGGPSTSSSGPAGGQKPQPTSHEQPKSKDK